MMLSTLIITMLSTLIKSEFLLKFILSNTKIWLKGWDVAQWYSPAQSS